ncbi:hypothetical protein A5733_06315 [Mycobacterium sp. NS-7484]|uniref:hypothetical protein n=1 Tax=Mycobacterium sp. NS-7484 TaxID=1834161 RepID=UPI00096DCF13|nr:hypothetical protein [Mycobacterium sp. NS-7484]OMB99193.1 hypothetical protein A5733_06315 [Mycobacterium sp. NS-7484]
MTPEEIRTEAIEVIVRAQSGYVPWCHAEAAVDALAEAGLLPTSVEWVARNTAGGGIVRSHRRAAEWDRDQMRLVPRPSVWDDEVPAEEYSHLERRYVTDWQAVAE